MLNTGGDSLLCSAKANRQARYAPRSNPINCYCDHYSGQMLYTKLPSKTPYGCLFEAFSGPARFALLTPQPLLLSIWVEPNHALAQSARLTSLA